MPIKIHRPKLSIIMPVFNEIKTVEQALRRVHALDIDKEIIVVDDYSTDGSREILIKLRPELKLKLILHAHNKGKGMAVRNAAAHAKGEYMVVEDADLELNEQDILKMLQIAESDPSIDMINGNRHLQSSEKVNPITKVAKIVTRLSTLVLYQKNIKDILCAYKLCKLNKFKSLQLTSDRFGIETEWVAKAIKAKWKIQEIDISYKPRGKKEHKKIHITDGFDIIWQLLKWRFVRS